MKKVMLCAVALLFGAVGFAQVTDADGNSSPTATTQDVLPGAPDPDANRGLSVQNGNANKVRVRQAGTSQSVTTYQDDGTGTGGNQARVMQTGAVQAASGVWNRADVMQSGTENQSTTKQEGDYNDAVTRQGQDDPSSSGNKALIRQGTGQQAEGNYAAIDQDGANNHARTQQTYDNSDAWTQQTGSDNMSEINQNASPDGSDGHYAMNQQEGDRNASLINQAGAGARNAARALQIGEDNKAQQSQIATDGEGGVGNDAGIHQGLRVGGSPGISPVAPEVATQVLAIDANVDELANPLSSSFWGSFGAKAKQTQIGVDNSAGIFQWGGSATTGSNYAEQEQEGEANNAGLSQSHYPSGGDWNYAKQDQFGSENSAGLAQEGVGLKSLQNQSGASNISWAYQTGECNQLNTHQFGDENVAYSTQHGAENATLIVQYDGQSYSVQQNKDLAQFDTSAGGNQADILQMGPDGDFGAGAVDCYFDDPLTLDMPTPVDPFDLGDICPDCD